MQEQLGAIKGVIVEALKPVFVRFDSLEKKMDEGVDKMNEKIDYIDQKFDKKFEFLKAGIDLLKDDTFELRRDMKILKANKTLRDNGIVGDDDGEPYSP